MVKLSNNTFQKKRYHSLKSKTFWCIGQPFFIKLKLNFKPYIMYNENEQIYLITERNLKNAIQEVIKSELKYLEERLSKKNKILTREEAAEIIKVCPNTISEYVKTGRLKNVGIGRKILIQEAELESIKPNIFKLYKKAS